LIEDETLLEPEKKFKDAVGAVSPPGRKPCGLEATAINSARPKSVIVVKNHSHQALTLV
jgi:hypothetical protein